MVIVTVLDIKFTRDVCVAVSEEIASQQEDICIKLIVTDENAQLLAEAIVNIWIMIEDEINIVLMVLISFVSKYE